MRIALNLASRPYIELGPLYLRLRILIAALALLAIPLWLLLRVETQKAAAAHARLAAVDQSINALARQQQDFQSDMRQPRNASVLHQSQFLNAVFRRKAFSWTAVMMDLENVLPSGVQVLNIDPVISKNGDVTIRLRVSGQHDRAVDLLRNLEHSRRFLSPRLAGEAAESTSQGGGSFERVSGGGVDFDILAEYNPLSPSSTISKEAEGTVHARPAKPSAHRARHRSHPAVPATPATAPAAPQKAGPR